MYSFIEIVKNLTEMPNNRPTKINLSFIYALRYIVISFSNMLSIQHNKFF